MKKLLFFAFALLVGGAYYMQSRPSTHAATRHTVRDINILLNREPATAVQVEQLGTHIIAEFHGCINLNDAEMLKAELVKAAEAAGATVLNVYAHQFAPQGMSGLVLLQESHLSIHTWPEFGYAAIDIYTCGAHVHSQLAIDSLSAYFKPTRVRQLEIERGYDKQ